MKYLCLGYIEPGKFEGMTEGEQHALLDECFEYNDHLRASGHVVAEDPSADASEIMKESERRRRKNTSR